MNKLKKLSVRLKITLWYVSIMTIISVTALVVMTSVSSKMLNRDITARLENTVMKTSKDVEMSKDIYSIPGFKYYENGVNMVLFDSEFRVTGGQIPFGISADDMSFSSGSVKTEKYNGNEYYIIDKKIKNLNGREYWLKGFVPVSDGIYAVKAAARNNALLTLFMIIAAAIGGYMLVGRILAPVNKIRSTADRISESNDLSERIRMSGGDDEFYKLAESFDKMLDKIERTVEREKQFTSDASHELRTPVAAVLSSCEYMTEYADTFEDIKDAAYSVKREAQRMSKLISQLLTISRMDKNSVKLNFESVDFGELLNFVCDEQVEIHSENIKLHRNIEENIMVKADRVMLARLIINLISNAYSYGKDGGNITVTLKKDRNRMFFDVSDDGIGIAEGNLEKIWERFYQADPSRSANENMGLGLSMVKWIAECHGGKISVKSKLGEGSTFSFEMPLLNK